MEDLPPEEASQAEPVQSDGYSQHVGYSSEYGAASTPARQNTPEPQQDISPEMQAIYAEANIDLLNGIPTPLKSALRNPSRDRSVSSRRVGIKEATVEATKVCAKVKVQEHLRQGRAANREAAQSRARSGNSNDLEFVDATSDATTVSEPQTVGDEDDKVEGAREPDKVTWQEKVANDPRQGSLLTWATPKAPPAPVSSLSGVAPVFT